MVCWCLTDPAVVSLQSSALLVCHVVVTLPDSSIIIIGRWWHHPGGLFCWDLERGMWVGIISGRLFYSFVFQSAAAAQDQPRVSSSCSPPRRQALARHKGGQICRSSLATKVGARSPRRWADQQIRHEGGLIRRSSLATKAGARSPRRWADRSSSIIVTCHCYMSLMRV